MAYPSLTTRLLEAIDRYACPRAQLYKSGEIWEAISATEMLRRIAVLSQALAQLGVRAGDRVGLFSTNRPEWHVADFAILGLGAVNVPIYFRESPDRMLYILSHSGAKVVFVAGGEQARMLLGCRERLPGVERIIVAAAPPDLAGDVLRYETLIAGAGNAEITSYRAGTLEVLPEQLATIIYTSGTTGEPKGVMLTHANFTSNVEDSFRLGELQSATDVALSFLPLAHVYERMLAYGYLFRGVPLAYVENMDNVVVALREVRPTVMAAVPRFFEKLYARIMEQGEKATGAKKAMFRWTMRVAQQAMPWRAYGRPVNLRVRAKWALADRLAYSRMRAGVGGRLRVIFSGGGPLARELAEFFWTIGVPIYQGYGLTETSPVVTTNLPANRVGSVGRAIPNVEVRIADDGEILVRGPCVMQGYYQKPEDTRDVLAPDGWLRTGDIGNLDADGYLYITDRKKDLIKTAAGKFVAPQPIENSLKSSAYILNAAVVGDRRKFVVALLVPNFETVSARAREIGLELSSPEEMAAHPWVRALMAEEVERVNAHMAQYERIKRFALLDHDFTFDGGQLTFTLKLKRRVIEEKYRGTIEQLYADVEEPRPISRP